MNITLYSDLHLEFEDPDRTKVFEPGEGEVCILAGDICMAEEIYRPMYHKFFTQVSERFDRAYYVMGNHEHYFYDFAKTEETLRLALPSNIILLQNQSDFYNGVHFIGATMWSDFHNANATEMLDAQIRMNDYHTITNQNDKLTPHQTLRNHDETITWFNQVLPTLNGKKVVITHHAPSFNSISKDYNSGASGCYATDLSNMIEYHTPDLWVHGHIHASNDYMIGNTRILSNPRGYTPDRLNPNFRTDSFITL